MVGKKKWVTSRCSTPAVVVGVPLPDTVAPPTGTQPDDAGTKWAGASMQSGPDFSQRLAQLEQGRHRQVLKWHIYVEQVMKRSNIFVGVQAREGAAGIGKYIGSDSFGWGFILNGALWTGGKKQKSGVGRRAMTGDLLTIYLDVGTGQMCVLQHPAAGDRRGRWLEDLGACERFGLQEEEQARLGVAARDGASVCGFGLRQHLPQCAIPAGLELAPSLSLYDPGDVVQMWMDYETPPSDVARLAAEECGVGLSPGALAPSGCQYHPAALARGLTSRGASGGSGAEAGDELGVSEEEEARLVYNGSLRGQSAGRQVAREGE